MFIIIYVVQYNINLYQLYKKIGKIVIFILIHLTRFEKGYIYGLFGKVLSIYRLYERTV